MLAAAKHTHPSFYNALSRPTKEIAKKGLFSDLLFNILFIFLLGKIEGEGSD